MENTAQSNQKQIRTLIVDDSEVMRNLLSATLDGHPNITVVGAANDPMEARTMIKELRPDVLTLDVEMPKMDGLSFLRNLMRLRPMPVVMVSSLTTKGATITLDAMAIGAVDFIAKPLALNGSLESFARELNEKVTIAARIDVSGRTRAAAEVAKPAERLPAVINAQKSLIAIGGSTGGTEAIKLVLSRWPESMPGIVITQHIPPKFSKPFAERLDGCSALKVAEAEDGAPIGPGRAYVAPGDKHLEVANKNGRLFCRLSDAAPEHYQKPSVDVLFRSVVRAVGEKAVGVVLTGMGRDGGDGLMAMHEAGASTYAQDEASSVVWGMPGHAVHLGAVDAVVSLNSMSKHILSALTKSKRRR